MNDSEIRREQKLEKKYNSKEKQERDFRYWLQYERSPYQNIGIGILNNTYYIGKTIFYNNKEVDVIITSDKEKFVGDEIKIMFGLNHRFPLFSDCIDYSWCNESIDRWLYDDGLEVEEYSIKRCFEIIRHLNSKQMYYPDERLHSFIALDIIKTYYKPIFEAMGRTFILAEKRSGKTKQSQIYGLLCFNPIFTSDISPASFYRVIESTGGTLIIDDFDSVEGELKTKIIQHIRTGYKYGSKAIRSDGSKTNKPIGFNNYAHVIINNTLGLDDITEDRCNKILLLRTKDRGITNRKLDFKDVGWNITRDKLHISTLLNWKKVKETYEKISVPELSDRDLEKVQDILTLAKCVGDDLYKEILGLVLEMNEQQNLKEIKDNWDFILFEYLYYNIKEDEKIKLKDVADVLAPKIFNVDSKDFERKKRVFSIKSGKILNSIPLFKRSVSMGYVHYTINRKDLIKYIELRNYHKYINDYSPNPTTTTTTTTTTNSTNKLVEEKVVELVEGETPQKKGNKAIMGFVKDVKEDEK